MADKKISQLTGASTPLTGTEVLPIVQSGSTVKVSVDNLTKGKTVNATTFDTDVAAAGVTLSGTTLAADGTDTNIDINLTPKGTGEVNITKVDIDAGAIDGTAIGANSASSGAFTTVSVSSNATDFANVDITNTSTGGISYRLASAGQLDYFNIPAGAFGIRDVTNNVTRVYWTSANTQIIPSGAFLVNRATKETTESIGAAFTGNNDGVHINNNDANPTGTGFFINFPSGTGTNTNTVNCFRGRTAGADRAFIYGNGGLANYQSNNVDLSDIRTKKDITPAASMWGKIGALEIVTYKYNDQTHDDVNVGVIAQQVESVEPVWVDADGFGDTPEDGVPLKTVYTKDITFAAIKALQEAMARIEKLEAEVAALKK